MIKYPNGKQMNFQSESKKSKNKDTIYKNRGMDFENDINISLEYFDGAGLAIITKRPTPINVVRVDYTHGAKIIDAYFEKQSTTDYNGVYRGKYIDFEAKNTKSKTSLPLHNITPHQISHLEKVIKYGGIAFFVISLESIDKVYLLDASYVISFYKSKERASIPVSEIIENGIEIKQGYMPRYQILEAIDEAYFHEENN
ncbi:MAG: Holliday junction resolvase RecU [Erysipelotrichales bacterium]|nr:Holliday junction resolvase RecU [Erysipelotrichales bacterium]